MDIVSIIFAYVLYFLLVHWVADFVYRGTAFAAAWVCNCYVEI